MELVIAAVEHDLLHARFQGPLGQGLAHGRGGGLVAAVTQVLAEGLIAAAGRNQGLARRVVDDLGVDVLVAAEDRQPRPEASRFTRLRTRIARR